MIPSPADLEAIEARMRYSRATAAMREQWIENARTDIPALISALRERDAEIERLREALRLEWRTDGYGHEGKALYCGPFYCGTIMLSVLERHRYSEWRGWFMHDDEGAETGWFKTMEEAKASVEAKARAALADDKEPGK